MGQFDRPDNEFNLQSYKVESITLIHEYSSTEYYIGVSNNGRDTSRATWQIRKIVKLGDVWAVTQYPDGDQLFKYVWDDRLTYTYV
jgi:hypothetical protein